jgi:hypothetical protein
MRRITLWLLGTVAALVLLFSYRTSTMGIEGTKSPPAAAAGGNAATAGPPGDDAGGSAGSGGSDDGSSDDGSSAGGGGSTSGGATTQSGTSSGNGTYQGSVAQTRWGPIQVAITTSGGKITDIAVPIYPNGNPRDEEINSYALPVLRQETLDAQSATSTPSRAPP